MNLSKYWTNSVEWQDDSLGGQLLQNSITQWGLELSESEKNSCDYLFFPGNLSKIETTYEITINIGGNTKAAFGRYLSCIMIGLMPDEGLEEALFSLHDILEFHSHKPTPAAPRLQPKAIDATITHKRKRPDLIIA